MSTIEEVGWRSRIVGHGTVDPASLLENPANWRVHPKRQEKALIALLDEVGWVRHVIVNNRSGHLVDGHLRVRLALARGESQLPVVYIDLSEDEERLVLASLDPIASLAATDSAALMALAASVSAPERPELTELVRDMSGMREPKTGSPTQPQIDARQEEIQTMFDERTQRSFSTKCPHCEHEFDFAR